MIIKEILSQSRRDFTALYECEHCGHTIKGHGYDDNHFHQKVVPNMVCASCNKTSVDSSQALTPKYPEGKIV